MEKVVRDGLVAVQHYTPNGWDVEIKSDGTVYNFRPSYSISMAWVKEEHLDKVLGITVKACCGKHQARFHLASQINVNLWETGNRHGQTGE